MVMEAVSAKIQLSQTSFQELSSLKRQQETQMLIKGKRTKRQRQASPLRLTMAGATASSSSSSLATSSPAGSNIEEAEDDQDMANCLILLAQGRSENIYHTDRTVSTDHDRDHHKPGNNNNLYVYQCKTCDRCFSSFQALGGHRASHKKPKLAASPNELDRCHAGTNTNLSLQIVSNSIVKSSTNKVHECSICGADFSSGQALGGHMRRHRTTSLMNNSSTATLTASKSSSTYHGPDLKETKKERQIGLELDLNLPAPPEESKFVFGNSKEQVIVFSAA